MHKSISLDDGQSQDRICSVTGPPDKVNQAVRMIQDLLAKANIMGVSQSSYSHAC